MELYKIIFGDYQVWKDYNMAIHPLLEGIFIAPDFNGR